MTCIGELKEGIRKCGFHCENEGLRDGILLILRL